jgi:2-methylcitrate dehydratase PrpD
VALMKNSRCVPSQDLAERFPGGRPARVVARLADGSEDAALVEAPLGDASRPMTDAQLHAKFLAQAQPVIGHEKALQTARAFMALEEVTDVAVLLQAGR